MPWTRVGFRIVPAGQTIILASVVRAGSSVTVYSDQALTSSVTLPAVMTTDTTFYVAEPQGDTRWHTINMTHPDGSSLAQSVLLEGGREIPVVITPAPSDAQVAADVSRPSAVGLLASGYYYFTHSPSNTTTATTTTGRLRLVPWYLPNAITINRIGAEVTSPGDAGSKFRIGIYADSNGIPGSLVLDAGTINGDSATVQEITVSQFLAPGAYWIGGATQVVTTTQPTLRVTNSPSAASVPAGTIIPASAAGFVGLYADSVTSALPATFTPGAASANAARVFVKVA